MEIRRTVAVALILFAVLIGVFVAFSQNGNPPIHSEADHSGEHSSLADTYDEGVEINVEAFRTPLAATGGEEPLDLLDSSLWIEGQISFSNGATYPGSLSSVSVVALSNGFPADLDESVGQHQGQFILFPVQPDGAFRIPVTHQGQTVELGAAGPFCAAKADVVARQGDSVTIPMCFAYGLDMRFVDADAGDSIVSNVVWVDKFTSFGVTEPCGLGFRSHLSSKYLLRNQPSLKSEPGLSSRYLVTSLSFKESGIGLEYDCNEPGYDSRTGTLFIPPLDGAIPQQKIELDKSDVTLSSVQIDINRPGDWDAYSEYEYHSQARLMIRGSSDGHFVLRQSQCDLSPGTRLIERIPLENPEVFLVLCSNQNLDSTIYDGVFWELDLERSALDHAKYTTSVKSSRVGAIAVPPTTLNKTDHAWFGVRLQGQSMISSRRYAAADGFLLDGLVPGVYDVFWSNDGKGNGREFRAMISSNTPLMELTVLPGINPMKLP